MNFKRFVPAAAATLLAAAAPRAQTRTLQAMAPERVLTLQGDTHHVQGVLADGATFLATGVDRQAGKGYLFEYDMHTGSRLRGVELQQGNRFHPGGIDSDGDSVWIPVAEYRPGSTTTVQRRSRKTLELIYSFEVQDHIGALAVGGGRLYAANWDARKIVELSLEGRVLRKRDNPTPLEIQDWKYRHGLLVAAATAPATAGGPAVAWFDPESLRLLKTMPAGATDRGTPFTNEGLDSRDGTLYLLPEDSPSRLFIFDAMPLANLNRPEREDWLRDLGFGMFIHWNVDVNLGSVISHSLVGADARYVARNFDVLPRYLNARRFVTRKPWKMGERRELTLKSVRATAETVVTVLGQSDQVLEYHPEVVPQTQWRQTEAGLVISAQTAQRMYDDRLWDKPVVLRITKATGAQISADVR